MPASCSSGSAPRSPCSTRSPTAATSTRAAARPLPRRWRRGWWPRGRIWAPPSTATPTAASWPTSTGDGARRRRHPLSLGHLAAPERAPGAAADRGHHDEQPRAGAGAGGARGSAIVRCNVGDRYVVETMQREGILLGGEQSGHIVQMRAREHRRRPADGRADRRARPRGRAVRSPSCSPASGAIPRSC